MAYVYRLEQLNERFRDKVNYGPWWGNIELASWVTAEDFWRRCEDRSHDNFKNPYAFGVEMKRTDVCGVRSYQELNEWFPNRFKRRKAYRVVKYYAPDEMLVHLPDQVVVNVKHLKQVAVLEMFG